MCSRTQGRIPTLLILILFLSLQGCSIGSFIGAYFNTYYNARKAFLEAETEVLSQQDPKQINKAFLAPYTVPAGAKAKFASVVEKCSKLLQYHPESSLVDDALLMIGKSFYYQNEHEKAERKFREIIEGYPESDLVLESRLLLVNTLYRMNSKDTAKFLARELVEYAFAAGERGVAANALLVSAMVEADMGNHAAARDEFLRAAELARSSGDRFEAWMRVAEMEERMENPGGAATAYDRAEGFASTYQEDYRARLGLARMQSKLGEHEESLEILDRLLRNANNRDFFGEINLTIGDTYKASGDIAAAITQYTFVDTTYPRTEVAARSYYALGLLYEKELYDYDSARIAYNKGKGEFTQAAVTPLLVERAEFLNKHASLHAEIAKNDSLRTAILYPPVPEVTDSAEVDDAADEIGHEAEVSLDEGVVQQNPDSLIDVEIAEGLVPAPDTIAVPTEAPPAIPVPTSAPTVPLDTVEARLAHAKTELASLFYSGIGVVDSAIFWFNRLLEDHPTSDFVPRALYTLAQIYSADTLAPRERSDSLYREITNRYPDSEFADASRRILGLPAVVQVPDEAEKEFTEAEQLILAGNNRAAITSLRKIITMYPESPWAARSRFAMGWIFEQRTAQFDSAIVQYERLAKDYPESEYAIRVRPKLAAVEAERLAIEEQNTPPSPPATGKNGDNTIPPPGKEVPPPYIEEQQDDSPAVPDVDDEVPPQRLPSLKPGLPDKPKP